MKFYAVRNGRKNGIFTSWKETEKSVKGYPNAQYRSFINESDAQGYLRIATNLSSNKKIVNYNQNNTLVVLMNKVTLSNLLDGV